VGKQQKGETVINKDVSILIVDNDEPLRWLLAKCLSCYYTCVTAGSVDEATEMLAATGYDLVITEIRMSGASGLELCQFVNRKWPDTAVLIMSDAADVVRGLQSLVKGVCDYVLKPIDLSQMLQSVEQVLQRKRTLAVVRSTLAAPASGRDARSKDTSGHRAVTATSDKTHRAAPEGDRESPAPAKGRNRRASVRVPYLCEVECLGIDFGSVIQRINDLSTGGVFIDAAKPFPVGSSFSLKFRVPDKEIRVTGEVRYSMPRIGMGVHFLDLGADDRVAIQSVVEDLTKMHSHKYTFGARQGSVT
jgi:DNA-binding response OmpR family regulator